MAIFKKDLSRLIKDAREKKEKVSGQIRTLENQKKAIELQIEKQTDQLVDCELEGDEENQRKFQASLKELRNDLYSFDGRINSYKKVLQKGVLNDKEANLIREAIKIEAADRSKRANPLNDEKKRAEKQIKSLQDRIKEIEKEVNSIYSEGNFVDSNIKNILDCIDPRAEKLDWRDKDQFVKNWIGGAPTEHFFRPKEESMVPKQYIQAIYNPSPEEIETEKKKNYDKETIPVDYIGKDGNPTTEYMTRNQARERGHNVR